MAKFKHDQRLLDILSKEEFSFIWDTGNESKNKEKHQVSCEEAMEVFLNSPIVPLGLQYQPDVEEDRFGILG